MTDKDMERAIDAFRWACPDHFPCKRLDRTLYHDCCFAYDCKKRNYKCGKNVCKRLRKFINILKEPEQDSYEQNYPNQQK